VLPILQVHLLHLSFVIIVFFLVPFFSAIKLVDIKEKEKKRYSLAVIPPMMLDSQRRSLRYHNENGLIVDPQAENKDAMLRVQYWSPAEIETFKERYLAHPKNFGYIANALDNKVCVLRVFIRT